MDPGPKGGQGLGQRAAEGGAVQGGGACWHGLHFGDGGDAEGEEAGVKELEERGEGGCA